MMQCRNNLREIFQYLIVDILSGSEFDRSLHNYILLTMWFFFSTICVRQTDFLDRQKGNTAPIYETNSVFNLRFSYSELFKAKTLEFFSKTLPILKADDTLPKVARYEDNHISQNPTLFHSKPGSRITFYHHRTKRSVAEESEEVVPKEEVVLYIHLYHSINTGCLRQISHSF